MRKDTIILTLLLPLCLASWEDDQGYQDLCGLKYQCRCPNEGLQYSQMTVDCKLRNITTLPSNILFPGKVEKVEFQNNHVTQILEYTFYNGHSVLELDLSNNRIDFVASSSFVAFEKLNILILSHNKLSSLPVRLFDGLKNLKVLDLGFNNIQAFLSSLFQPVPQLVELKLKFNPLVDLDDISFKYLPHLHRLDLENTSLSKLPESIFSFTPQLSFLSLANNEFTNVPTRALSKCKGLNILEISENSIKEIHCGAFYGLANLTALFINGQHGLKAIRECAFGDLIKLKTLQCSYNLELDYVDEFMFYRIRDNSKSSVEMVGPIRIEDLRMKENALTYIGNIVQWENLHYLDLRGNPFKCDCRLRWMTEGLPSRLKENIRCASPSSLANIQLSALSSKDFVCSWYLFTDNIVIFIALLMASIFLFFWILFLSIYFICKLKMKLRTYSYGQYKLIVPKADRIELEWDHSADP